MARQKVGWMIDKLLIKLMKRRVRKAWGANCPTNDIDDFPDLTHDISSPERCDSCVAKEFIEWLDGWEELL
jgi:hypothetical protein